MDAYTNDERVIHEDLWRRWVHHGKMRRQATARKLKIVAAFVLGLLVVGSAIYINVVK